MSNKKLIFVLGIIFIIFIIIFLFSKESNKEIFDNSKDIDENLTSNFLIKKISEEDKDGDGLKDWEEILWKTDPNNVDTDGDGTNDNEEVLNNRDPLKKGPNDVIQNLITNNKEIKKDNENLNDTEDVAKDLLLGYLSLKQSNLLDQNNQEALISSILNDKFNNNLENKYSDKDINIIYKNDKETLTTYGSELVRIFKENSSAEDSLFFFKKFTEENDQKYLEELKDNIIIFNNIKKELLSLKVPNELKEYHLNIINIINNISNNTEKMSNVMNDPIKGLINLKEYSNNEIKIVNELKNILIYLKDKGIIFNI